MLLMLSIVLSAVENAQCGLKVGELAIQIRVKCSDEIRVRIAREQRPVFQLFQH